MKSKLLHLYAIFYALSGFALWVVADTCMKLAGEADLPPYEVVGFLGFFAAFFLAIFYAGRGKLRQVWPKKPAHQMARALLAFGCVMANAVALKHLSLTMFYIVVFLSPMLIALLASIFLHEKLGLAKVAAIVVGFLGVVIAVDPWQGLQKGCDLIGYAVGGLSALFYAASTISLRVMAQNETPQAMVFLTGLTEAVLGLIACMIWASGPVAPMIILVLVLMGMVNVSGNILNVLALRHTKAATVEQFHYTQIVFGALLGFLIWHEIPTLHLLLGAAVIIGSGIYVAAATHSDAKRDAAKEIL